MGLFGKKKRDAARIRFEIELLQKELSQLEGQGNQPIDPDTQKASPVTQTSIPISEAPVVSSASNALFATLSHELRTPLNGVMGMAQLLKEELDSPKLETLVSCAQHMQSVLHTLVNLSKIQSEWGHLPVHREWVNLRDLLEQIKKNIAHHALARRLSIQMQHVDDRLRLRGDFDHLVHIIETALLASLECTQVANDTQDEALSVSWEVNGDKVKITIENPLEIMPVNRGLRIFEVTRLTVGQHPERIRMEYLYWAVSNSLLEHYGGAMVASKLTPQIGVKTVLAFHMENMTASPSYKSPVGGLSLGVSGKSLGALPPLSFSLKVLVVEDDPINRDLMTLLLERVGQQVELAENGQVALDMLTEQGKTYDLILMDIDMPIMDGVTTARSIRLFEDDAGSSHIPIAAVTAFNTLSDRSKFKKAGMEHYLSKPVSLADLRATIIEVSRLRKS